MKGTGGSISKPACLHTTPSCQYMSRPSLRGGYLEAEAKGSNRSKGTEKKRYANTQYPPHRWGAEQWVGANCGAERGAARRTDLEGPGERPRWARGGTLGRCPSTEAKEM